MRGANVVVAVVGGWSLACSAERLAELQREGERIQQEQEQQERERAEQQELAEQAAWDSLPEAERAFCSVLTEHAKLYRDAPNDLKKSAARGARGKALRAAVPAGKVAKWSATVKTLTTTSQGNAILEMKLPCSPFGIGTWNNELSDIGSETLIPISSAAFATLAEMHEGSGIWFNGRLVVDPAGIDGFDETSITELGSMTGGYFLVQLAGR